MAMAFAVLAALAGGTCTFNSVQLAMGILHEKHVVSKKLTFDDVVEDRRLCFMVLAAVGIVVSSAVSLWLVPLCVLAAFLVARKAPSLLARRRREALRSACDGQLDLLADIVAMGVRAGLSFDTALDLFCAKFSCELSTQLMQARSVWKSGMATRERALLDLAKRLDSKALRRFSETVVQAIAYGSPLADALVSFADDMRASRLTHVEQQVAKAPVKMFLPLGTCILPAMLLLVMGPVVLQFLGTGL